MKLIIECDHDGCVFAYYETEKHFKEVEHERASYERRKPSSLAEDCRLGPGEYLVINGVKKP